MKQKTVKIISVNMDVQYPTKAGDRTYAAYVIDYVDQRGQKASWVKPNGVFNFNKTLKNKVSELKPGETYTLYIESNKNGYDDLVDIQVGEGDPVAAEAAAASTPRSSGGGKVTGSNYETAEERKVKQRLIVRQATLNASIEIGGSKNTVEDILARAEKLEEWVYRGF